MKKHILFCIDTLTGGGAEKVLIEILKNIDTDRYSIDLLILNDFGVYFDEIPQTIHWFLMKDVNVENYLSKEYDIEIAFLEGQATRFIAFKNSKACKIAWVHIDLFTFHWSLSSFKNKAEEAWCYSQMDKIVCVSRQVECGFNKLFPTLFSEQRVIYNLIDGEKIRRLADAYFLEKKKLTLCSVGRLTEQKAYHRLIPILHKLHLEGYEFEYWIIGEGHQREELESLIEELGLQEIVLLSGFKENPYPYLKAADIFVQASLVEGFSLALCEAVCMEKPILTTLVSGANEILDDGKVGLIVEQDTFAIYDGIRKLIEDEAYRKVLSRRSSARSVFFNVKNTMTKLYELFESASRPSLMIRASVMYRIDFINRYKATGQDFPDKWTVNYPQIGHIIALYTYAKHTKEQLYEKHAEESLDHVLENEIEIIPSLGQEQSLCSLGCGLIYLLRNDFVEGEEDGIVSELDNRLFTLSLHWEKEEKESLYGWIHYLTLRIDTAKETLVTPLNKQNLILLLDRLEETEITDEDVWKDIQKIDALGIFPERTKRLLHAEKKARINHLEMEKLQDERVTFVIPVRIDSTERKENLDAVLAQLSKRAQTQIILLEADSGSVYTASENYPNVTHCFVKDDNPIFYRTKYLNELLRMTETDVVGIWDTDVIVPDEQIDRSIADICEGKAVMSFPYDDRFNFCSMKDSLIFYDKGSIDDLKKKEHTDYIPHSVGGAFLVHKDIYLQAGGENEHFYGWGAEDMERVKRMEILGLPVTRIGGSLFHLFHHRNANSGFYNHDSEINSRKEYLKVCGMQKEQLIRYIQTWTNVADRYEATNSIPSRNPVFKQQFRTNPNKETTGFIKDVNPFISDKYSTNTIQLLPIGGLCNRMKAIESAIYLSKEVHFNLSIYWEPNRFLYCPFELLFCPIERVEIKTIQANTFRLRSNGAYDLYDTKIFHKYESMKYISAIDIRNAEDREEFMLQQAEKYPNLVLEANCNFFFPNNRPYSLFKPITSIQKSIDERVAKFNNHTIGIHIRRTDNEKSIQKSSTELFIKAVEKEICLNPSVNFYLATDDFSVKEDFVKKFGAKMSTNWVPVVRSSIEGIQEAVTELYSLSKTTKILGSYWSSFSETASDISGIPLQIIK